MAEKASSSWSWEDTKTLAWEVWKVYKSWGMWIYHKYRPYRPHFTWPNISMALVTLVAIIVGFWVLFRKHQKRKQLEEERERRLSFNDDFFIKHDQLKNIRPKRGSGSTTASAGGQKDEIRKNIDKKRHQGGGDGPRITELDDDELVRDSDDDVEEDEDGYADRSYLTKDGRDPFDLAMHIPSELKKIQNKITTREMEKQLTQDQKEEEAKVRREQLEQIFKLMNDQKDKFGDQNSTDIEEQMRMYAL